VRSQRDNVSLFYHVQINEWMRASGVNMLYIYYYVCIEETIQNNLRIKQKLRRSFDLRFNSSQSMMEISL